MHKDDECSGPQQEDCTLAMLQRRQDAEESSMALDEVATGKGKEGAAAKKAAGTEKTNASSGNMTEPSKFANATTPEVSKPEGRQEAHPPEVITVTLVPEPPAAEEAPPPPAAEEAPPPPAAEEMPPPPAVEEVPPSPAAEEAHQKAMEAAEAAEEAEAMAVAAAVAEAGAEAEAEAEAQAQLEAQAEDEADAEAEAYADADSEAMNMPELESLSAAQLDTEEYLPITEKLLDPREFEEFGASSMYRDTRGQAPGFPLKGPQGPGPWIPF